MLFVNGRMRTEQTARKAAVLVGVSTGWTLLHNYDIFEGTEQIQQLVIGRALSGMRIEL